MNFPRPNDDCEALAPFVMALFDGEADDCEAQRARAHLLVCQQCARRWLDWNRSRDLLRSVAVPAPPPTLLWRVLMACRLGAFTQERRFKTGVSRDFSAYPTSKTRAEPAPEALSAQILARTTRAEAPLRRERRMVSFLALPSLAVPALAILLIALQNTGFVALAPSESLPRPQNVPGAAPRLKAIAVPRAMPAKPKNAAVFPPARPKIATPRVLKARADDAPTPALPALDVPPIAPRPVVAARTPSSPPVTPASPPRVELLAKSVAPPAIVALSRLSRPRPALVLVTAKPARLSAPSKPQNVPALRAATWKISTPVAVKAASEALPSRVALPPTPPRLAAPPEPLLLAENIETDDERVEEMREVVEDFRAELTPDGFQTIDFEGDGG